MNMLKILLPLLILFASCKTPSILVTQEQQAGDLANNNGDFQAAIDHYKKCLETSMKLGVYRNTDMEAQICRKVSHAYQTSGKYADALIYSGYATTLDSVNKNPLGFLEDIRETGKIQLMQGNLLRGMATLERSLEMSEGLENSLKDANKNANAGVQLALANANLMLGNLVEAENNALAARKIFSQTNELAGLAEASLLLGNIMSDQGNLEKGIQYLEESIHTALSSGLNTSRQYKALSENMLLTGNYENALRYILISKNKADSSRIVPQMIWAEVGIGDVYRLMGDDEKANQYYYESLQISGQGMEENKGMKASIDWRLGNVFEARDYFTSQQSRLASGLTFLRIGEIYMKQNLADSALQNLNQAVRYFKAAGSTEGISRTGLYMARTYLDAGDVQKAKIKIDEVSSMNKNPDLNWQIYFLQGFYFELTDEKVKAVDAYIKSINEIESFRTRFSTDELKSSYMGNKMEVYDRLIRLLMNQGFPEEALQFAERGKARAFLDLIGTRKVGDKHNEYSPLVEKEHALSAQILLLKKQYNQGLFEDINVEEKRTTIQEVSEELARIQQQYAELLIEIKLNNPDYNSLISVQPAEMSSVQERLGSSEVLLEYWTGNSNSIIWVIRKSKINAIILPQGANEIDKYVENFRNAIESLSPETKQLARQGYDWLWLPISSLIKEGELVGIIPHGVLHLLPFQALMDARGRYLVENNPIFYTPSATIYYQNTQKPTVGGDKLLAMALGEMNIGMFSALPGTQKEVEGIKKIWPDIKTATEAQSTEGLVKSNSSGYQYIHLATHGVFNEDQPVYSFLLFAPSDQDDGQLTVNEVFSLSLNAKVVVLSACQTGLGKVNAGDEMVGLSRAFIYAGSRSVLASLWSVADEPTAALMVGFYTYLKDHSLNEALCMAEKDVMKHWPEPLYWAPFILVGNGF
jgi:CHAT domain-containing protein